MLIKYLIHAIFFGMSLLLGYRIQHPYMGGVVGLVGVAFVVLGVSLEQRRAVRLFWGMTGAMIGFIPGSLFNTMVLPLVSSNPHLHGLLNALFFLSFSYIGLIMGMRLADDPDSLCSKDRTSDGSVAHKTILDTSVIIDGRIADIGETGFFYGTYIVPQFVLMELQVIADSSDPNRRSRGRQGLDVLQRIQKMDGMDVQIVNNDFPHIKEVDAKIVALAQQLSAKIVTNDQNLEKIAQLQGVKVLNINQLSTALKPTLLPGETVRILLLKDGKELGQAVGYTDDGTMVVVADARRWIGKMVPVMVTSIRQTTSGRMIFSRLHESRETVPVPIKAI